MDYHVHRLSPHSIKGSKFRFVLYLPQRHIPKRAGTLPFKTNIMKPFQFIIPLTTLFTLALSDLVQYDAVYDNSATSLTVVACSDSKNGLITKRYKTFGSLFPHFPTLAPQVLSRDITPPHVAHAGGHRARTTRRPLRSTSPLSRAHKTCALCKSDFFVPLNENGPSNSVVWFLSEIQKRFQVPQDQEKETFRERK
jgi:cerato-platanin